MSSAFIKKQKYIYKKLKPCYCPALQETVHFNATGLNHILYYRRRPRKQTEQHYRATLIKYIIGVIENSTVATKEIKSKKPLVVTWNLQHKIKDNNEKQTIKVILIKEGAGNINFLSVMRRKNLNNKANTKKPKAKKL